MVVLELAVELDEGALALGGWANALAATLH